MGYVATTALFAWCTFFAVVAPRLPRPLATMSFWFGLGLNEVPFVGIYVLVASTALAAAQGDLESPGAKVTAAVAAVATVGLAVSAWRGLRTDQAVGRALERGLGGKLAGSCARTAAPPPALGPHPAAAGPDAAA